MRWLRDVEKWHTGCEGPMSVVIVRVSPNQRPPNGLWIAFRNKRGDPKAAVDRRGPN
jgi:hypothetical protein